MTVGTYSPHEVILTLGGIIFTGFADGTYISVTCDDNFEKKRGADGIVNRINKKIEDYTVNATLKQTSPTNNGLTTAYLIDRETNQGKLPLLMKDLNGTTLLFSPQAWIVKLPDVEYSDTLTNRVWKIDAAEATFIVGGNL